MLENKNILILSVSSWNSKVGADTWPTLMEGISPDNVASLSLREEIPDSKASNHFFVISENRVLKSVLDRSIKTGKRVERSDRQETVSSDLAEHNARYQKMGKKRNPIWLFARELVWKLGKWKTKELDDFLTEFNPDIILYSMDGYIHFNRLCRYVKKKTSAKAIGFFVDDNFTYRQTNKLGLRVFRVLQRHSLKKLARNTDAFWAITDMTKKEADETFGIDCVVVTKPLKKEAEFREWQVNDPIRILYTGNLGIGRDKSLVKVVSALREINSENNKFIIDVYTKTALSDDIKEKLSCDFCKIHEPIPQSEVLLLQEKADILLFLEDVDGPNAKVARLSFSTKITDYLSSGRSVFAVGCLDTAPMQYFKDNNAAIIATNVDEMTKKFNEILQQPSILCEYAKNAVECGNKNHKKENVLDIVQHSIEQLLK